LRIDETNEILSLMKRWDVGNIEVGMISFVGSPVPLERGTQVGFVEADPLIVLNNKEEMLVEETGMNGHILWYVAKNPSSFLNALVVAARFLSERTIGLVDLYDIPAAKSIARDCTRRAGGDRYSAFYSMLLGVE
jgi:hypothetical protein